VARTEAAAITEIIIRFFILRPDWSKGKMRSKFSYLSHYS